MSAFKRVPLQGLALRSGSCPRLSHPVVVAVYSDRQHVDLPLDPGAADSVVDVGGETRSFSNRGGRHRLSGCRPSNRRP
jgi:hypothetical protein